MQFTDAAVQRVLEEYEARSAEETRRWHSQEWKDFVRERDQFLLAVGPETGQFMNLLIREAKHKVILEIGTLELQENKQEYARERMARAGLADVIEFRRGDALNLLANLDINVDFVLLDLWKDLYIPCFDLFYPRLNPDAIVVADNMTFPESARTNAAAYRQHVRSEAELQSILLPIGSGLEVSRCTRGSERK